MVTNDELENYARILSNMTGIEYYVDHAYGKVRLMTSDGSRDVSPRLSRSDLIFWMDAFRTGMQELYYTKIYKSRKIKKR
jgi:hypothetical protein